LDACSNRGAKREMGGTAFKWGGRAPLAPPLATALEWPMKEQNSAKDCNKFISAFREKIPSTDSKIHSKN